MATITKPEVHVAPNGAEIVERRRAQPVLWFAGLGAACLGLIIYLLTAWIASGDAHRVPTGPDPVPGYMRWSAHIHQFGSPVVIALCLYFIVFRRRRQAGHITWDGMAFLACLTLYWQDPLANYFQPFFNYNSTFINFGSWACWIPGYQSPNACRLPEPFLWSGLWYGYMVFAGVVFTCFAMRKARQRWPRMGLLGTIGVALATLVVLDVVAEMTWMRMGLYHEGSAARGWTLGYGHFYELPIYESFAVAAWVSAMACLRFFRDDRGLSFAERGIDKLQLSSGKKNFVRFLAIAGFFNLSFFALYNVPAMFFGLKAGAWPQDIQKRSYLTNGLCGGDTGFACPGPSVPIARTGRGIHIDPDGKLVVPAGAQVPGQRQP